jgi:predicted nucleotide-binding protein
MCGLSSMHERRIASAADERLVCHLARMAASSSRPRLFIGSSAEGKPLAEELQALLDPYAQPSLWDQDVFALGAGALDSLIAAAQSFSFAAFVLTPDDFVLSRGVTRPTARDNLLFEAGLFLGGVGPGRVFLIVPQDLELKLPSDLAGITTARWRGRDDDNLRAALNPAALEIRRAILAAGPLEGPSAATASGDLLRFARGALRDVFTGASGLSVQVQNQDNLGRWAQNLLQMLLVLFEDREAEDIYAAWLRPESDPDELRLAASRNLPTGYEHYPFRRGEGLAGRVWDTGQAAATSELRRHEWWELREGCENQAYLCVPVGNAGGPGGVLAVGSDSGIEVRDGDLQTLELFAGLLALSTLRQPSSSEQILRKRLELLDEALSARRSDEEVELSTLGVLKSQLQLARELRPDDGLLQALPEIAGEAGVRVGGVRVLVAQIVAALQP